MYFVSLGCRKKISLSNQVMFFARKRIILPRIKRIFAKCALDPKLYDEQWESNKGTISAILDTSLQGIDDR
tara:strand:- start:441 stop:653 length:213 start_codon:yes stop_codon:yes gene_type:complete